MPSSRPNTIPTVIHLVRQLQPSSILDVGIGFGKWGHLFREYTDILAAERNPRRYLRQNWQVRIDGIEGHAEYLTDMHRFLYNHIFVGDALEILRASDNYDLIFMGDILEHFEKQAGFVLLAAASQKANQAVIVTTPKFETAQPALCGNEMERHRSVWAAHDFAKFPRSAVKTIDRATLLAVLPKPGAPDLEIKPAAQPGRVNARRLLHTMQRLTSSVPANARFILIDEEQFRPLLAHSRAVPFLEKDGAYWGPPPDDQTAIRELERLRNAGAQFLAVTWPSFWWLEYYAGFNRYLREQFACVTRDKLLVVFDLTKGAGAT